jgi:hypothetical protein
MLTRILANLFVLVLLSDAGPVFADPPSPKYEAGFALVVGEGRYLAPWGNLSNVAQETKSVADKLRKLGFQVTLLTDVTSDTLRQKLERLVSEEASHPDARIVVFLSGHGDTRTNGSRGYFVPVDTPLKEIDESGFIQRAISMEEIRSLAATMKAKHVIFFFDSCFSGSIFTSFEGGFGVSGIGDLDAPVRQFITAGSANEKSPAKSAFVRVLLRGLDGEADLTRQGFVTGTELGMFIANELSLEQSGQTPQFGKLDVAAMGNGEIAFGPYPVGNNDEIRKAIGTKLDAGGRSGLIDPNLEMKEGIPVFDEVPIFHGTRVFGDSLIAHGCWFEGCVQNELVQDSDGKFNVESWDVLAGNEEVEKYLKSKITTRITQKTKVSVLGFVRGTNWVRVQTGSGILGFVDLKFLKGVTPPSNAEYRIARAQKVLSEFSLYDFDLRFGRYHSGVDGLLNDAIRAAIVSYKKYKTEDSDDKTKPRSLTYTIDQQFLDDLETDVACWRGC